MHSIPELTDTGYTKLREYLKTVLSVGVTEIVFEKADGTIRVLKGTRDKDLIQEDLYEKVMNPPLNQDGTPRKVAKTSLPTFDIEAGDWRSFSLKKLISVNGLNSSIILKNAQINLEEDQNV